MSRKKKRRKKNKFKHFSKVRSKKAEKGEKTITGVISFPLRSQGAFVRDLEGNEVYIPDFCTNTAMHEDEVEVTLLKNAPNRHLLKEACVTRIIKRNNTQMVGVLKADLSGLYFVPDNKHLPQKMLISQEDEKKYNEHDKVLVEFKTWRDPKTFPEVSVIEKIGKAGEHETETKAILLSYGFPTSFPPQVENYAKKIKELSNDKSDYKFREDLRDRITFTIDPDDAKDFDDAISVKKTDAGYEIGVHIADVTHYVKYSDPIDKEAQKRGTSVYLVDRTIPMLPEVLSNDLCSLNPNEEKRAFSVLFNFDKEFNLLNHRFVKSIIKSNKRFTYKEAQNVIDTSAGPFVEELKIIKKLANKLREERLKKGGLDFDTPELEFKLDKDGKVVDVSIKERLETMKIIEDLMLLANRKVAEFMQSKIKSDPKKTFIFRVHDEPDPEKIEELSIFLDALGYELKHNKGKTDLISLSKMLKTVQNSILKSAIESATIRAMAKAVYSHKNIGHFSLGFDDYTHFTSPIRRYPDIMVHRILYAELTGTSLPQEELAHYRILAVESSKREVEAMKAERDNVRLKQLEYMQEKIGEEFICTVTWVSKNGVFMTDEKTLAEGFAPLSAFDAFYVFDEKTRTLHSKHGPKIMVGSKIKAILKNVNLEDKTMEWKPVEVIK